MVFKISELKPGQSRVDVEAEVKTMEEPRIINKYGREIKVANALIEDDSGSIKLTLWNEDVDRIKQGDKIKVINGYVNEFQGEKQLTAGKFGKIEKLGESAEEPKEETAEEGKTPEEEKTDGLKEELQDTE